MSTQLLHVFRNTPLGRETLMQSIYFCNMLDVGLTLYIPDAVRFMMYFDQDAVQVDLDRSYLNEPETAAERAVALAAEAGLKPQLLRPKNRTGRNLPDIPTHFAFMCCPRSVSDLSSKIGLGYIGPKVRRIIRSADFSVLLTSPVFKPWKSVAVLFGGSDSSLNSLRSGIDVARRSGCPLDLFIQVEGDVGYYEQRIREAGLEAGVARYCRDRYQYTDGQFANNLYDLPHDALVFSGAYGHGLIKNMLFGSKVELAQATLTNSLLVSGPNSRAGLNLTQCGQKSHVDPARPENVFFAGLDTMRAHGNLHSGRLKMKLKTAVILFFLAMGLVHWISTGAVAEADSGAGGMQATTVFSYHAGPGDSMDTMRVLALYGAKHEAVVRAAGQLADRGLLNAYGERQMAVCCLVVARLSFSIADESFSKDGRTCKVTIKSRVSLSDFVSAEIEDAALEKEEQRFSLQEEMEPTVPPGLDPARALSRAYRYIRKHHWRMAIIYLDHLEKKYPHWGALFLAKAMGFEGMHETQKAMDALSSACHLGNQDACVKIDAARQAD